MIRSDTSEINRWDRFWFRPESVQHIALIRGILCLIAALYFLSCWADVAFWYGEGRPFSPQSTARFWQTAGLEQEASWNVSPLFLTDAVWVYHAYLLAGMALSLIVLTGRGGRFAGWILWMLLVGWANRAMILSGLTETLLSLGLFATAIAPAAPVWSFRQAKDESHWTARLSARLLAVQITMVGLVTCATMLGGRVWFNGVGSYALAASAEDRTIDWTATGSWLVNPLVHEPLTHLLVLALPIGFALAWRESTWRYGQVILLSWCAVIAFLGSWWLYAATFATMVFAIRPTESDSAQ